MKKNGPTKKKIPKEMEPKHQQPECSNNGTKIEDSEFDILKNMILIFYFAFLSNVSTTMSAFKFKLWQIIRNRNKISKAITHKDGHIRGQPEINLPRKDRIFSHELEEISRQMKKK